MYNLFRQLGLRHIFVVPRPSRVVGLITRKDLLLEVIIYTFSLVKKYIFSLSGLSSKSYVVSGGWQYCDGGAPIDECKVLMFLLAPQILSTSANLYIATRNLCSVCICFSTEV